MELRPEEWCARRTAHEARVDALTAGHRGRAARGEAHAVEDFLFTYYSHRPSRLRRWSPGVGVVLLDHPVDPPYVAAAGGAVLPPVGDRARRTASFVGDLLSRTAERPAQLACFGLHEWAMAYRGDPRHRDHPLRLGAEGTDHVVEQLGLRCTHHDAFRFFTADARPRNPLQLTRVEQAAHEQPGCLHANMDLYKWAYKLAPWVPAELVVDCFALAKRLRLLDMRASPYDLRALDVDPVPIETAAGRGAYAEQQRALAEEAAPLRQRLRDAAQRLIR